MRIAVAQGQLLESILDLTHPTWGEGLSREAYGKWNRAQLRTRFGRDRLQRVALIDDDGRLLATAKRYRFNARLDGRDGIVLGIAAVFTPPELRGAGHARALITQLIEEARRAGALAAVLFSEIGASFYERLGFSVVPLDEVTVEVELKGGAPAMLVRAGDDRDIPDVVAMDRIRSAAARFALRRDASLFQYALTRKRLLAGLGPSGLRQVEFFVAEEGASAVAYVLLSVNRNGWTLEEAGDRDPAGARLGAMLQVLAAREPSQRAPLIRTWWPRSFVVPPQLRLSNRGDSRDLLMVRSLVEPSRPLTADDIFYWRSDYF
ncbi:MAG TPA: GNAT family N-acetyltransferase [Vicinamibacterales bacterium]|nr:GNAT family N-acetyltransferase [Vicinamibacterales bacterium]